MGHQLSRLNLNTDTYLIYLLLQHEETFRQPVCSTGR
jgi:hypothetical protein